MGLTEIPRRLRNKFRIDEREHAIAILKTDFPREFKDVLDCLDAFWLRKTHIEMPGKNRSEIPRLIDNFLQSPDRGWEEKRFDTKFVVDGTRFLARPTRSTTSKTALALRSSGTIRPSSTIAI
jgi:hypothetical protein